MPSIRESALPVFTASMRREEDFQRSKEKLAGQIPLINIYKQIDNFILSDFPEERLCLNSASPISIYEGGNAVPQYRYIFHHQQLI